MKNSVATLTQFIHALKVPVMPESVEKELTLHPDYLSLFSISDVLTNWNIPNVSYKVKAEDLTNISCPFIAVSNKEQFMLVSDIDEKKVIVSNEKWQKYSLDIEDFFQIYGGIVLVAEPDKGSGEEDYSKKRRQTLLNDLRIPFVLSGLLVILASGILMHSSYLTILNWQTALLTLFKSAGLITSILLLIYSVDAHNPIVQRLCTGMNSNCNSILSSKAAKITEEVSWSEAGFFYFAGTWLVLLFNSGSLALMQLLTVLNLLSLPYTFYSIYFQAKIAKQWCIFCCTIQGLFWLEFFVFFPYLLQPFRTPEGAEWSSLLICMTIPILSWVFIKPYLLKSNQLDPAIQQLNSFKYDPVVLSAILNKEQQYALLDEEHTIVFGNQDSEHIITIVSNPYCNPCAAAHRVLDKWLDTREDIKLQIIFHANSEKNHVWRLANHLLSLKTEQNNSHTKQALTDWFGQKHPNYEAWNEIHPIKGHASHKESVEKQKEWCRLAGIKATPEIFINGRRLPKSYTVADLKYFI